MSDDVQLSFRNADENDTEQLATMSVQFYQEDPGGDPMTADKVRRTAAELSAHPDKGRIIIFSERGCTVGYGILIHFWSNEYGGDIIFIDELYVIPEARNRGIATSFFHSVFLQYAGVAVAFQLEVTPRNSRAKDLYLRLGFRPAKNAFMFLRNGARQAPGECG